MVDPTRTGGSKESPRKSVRIQDQTILEKKASKMLAQESLETSPPREVEDEDDSEPELSMKDVQRQMASLSDQVRWLT